MTESKYTVVSLPAGVIQAQHLSLAAELAQAWQRIAELEAQLDQCRQRVRERSDC